MKHNFEKVKLFLPKKTDVEIQMKKMSESSCAVVGASSSLKNCSDAKTICQHDVVIHVNDHPAVRNLTGCGRVEVHVANQYACFVRNRFDGAVTHTKGKYVKCSTSPTEFRVRHEWNFLDFSRFATNAWLTTGLLPRRVHEAIKKQKEGRCCATAGGIATGLALHVCRRVTIFGLAGVRRGHIEDDDDMLLSPPTNVLAPVHNVVGESEWITSLREKGVLEKKC